MKYLYRLKCVSDGSFKANKGYKPLITISIKVLTINY